MLALKELRVDNRVDHRAAAGDRRGLTAVVELEVDAPSKVDRRAEVDGRIGRTTEEEIGLGRDEGRRRDTHAARAVAHRATIEVVGLRRRGVVDLNPLTVVGRAILRGNHELGDDEAANAGVVRRRTGRENTRVGRLVAILRAVRAGACVLVAVGPGGAAIAREANREVVVSDRRRDRELRPVLVKSSLGGDGRAVANRRNTRRAPVRPGRGIAARRAVAGLHLHKAVRVNKVGQVGKAEDADAAVDIGVGRRDLRDGRGGVEAAPVDGLVDEAAAVLGAGRAGEAGRVGGRRGGAPVGVVVVRGAAEDRAVELRRLAERDEARRRCGPDDLVDQGGATLDADQVSRVRKRDQRVVDKVGGQAMVLGSHGRLGEDPVGARGNDGRVGARRRPRQAADQVGRVVVVPCAGRDVPVAGGRVVDLEPLAKVARAADRAGHDLGHKQVAGRSRRRHGGADARKAGEPCVAVRRRHAGRARRAGRATHAAVAIKAGRAIRRRRAGRACSKAAGVLIDETVAVLIHTVAELGDVHDHTTLEGEVTARASEDPGARRAVARARRCRQVAVGEGAKAARGARDAVAVLHSVACRGHQRGDLRIDVVLRSRVERPDRHIAAEERARRVTRAGRIEACRSGHKLKRVGRAAARRSILDNRERAEALLQATQRRRSDLVPLQHLELHAPSRNIDHTAELGQRQLPFRGERARNTRIGNREAPIGQREAPIRNRHTRVCNSHLFWRRVTCSRQSGDGDTEQRASSADNESVQHEHTLGGLCGRGRRTHDLSVVGELGEHRDERVHKVQ